MITRRVYRSGEGEYYINKSACRLRDIVDLFRDTAWAARAIPLSAREGSMKSSPRRARTAAACLRRRRASSNTARARRRAKSGLPTCATTSLAWRISLPSWRASWSRLPRPARRPGGIWRCAMSCARWSAQPSCCAATAPRSASRTRNGCLKASGKRSTTKSAARRSSASSAMPPTRRCRRWKRKSRRRMKRCWISRAKRKRAKAI